MMRILAVASECAPFVKTGGLADVVGALAKALSAKGVQSRTLLPLYPQLAALAAKGTVVARLEALNGGAARLISVEDSGVDLLLLEAPHLFERAGHIYLDQSGKDWSDTHLRYGALSYVGARIGAGLLDDWQPDLVHCHDWQAGLTPVYLKQAGRADLPTVITVHNIAFQGLFAPDTMAPLGLSPEGYTTDGFEYYSKVGFLKAGLTHAHKITTVSPTYARELLTPEFGMGLQGVMAARQGDLVGILNGIDTEVWDPETDPSLAATYSVRAPKGKAANKAALTERFGLPADPGAPLFAIVSRLTQQKGLDLVVEVLPQLLARGGRLVVLGTGEPALEQAFAAQARQHPDKVAVRTGFDEGLAHLIQAGADAILVPSRFEPCGLTQLCALRYGTVPVVSHTGGLADTVIDANPAALAAGVATGFQFAPTTAAALAGALDRCFECYAENAQWASLIRRAMKHPVGWEDSADIYVRLYQSLAMSSTHMS